jgi:1-acyl-sn-glycerol-3-phosphate acyltransferase
MPNNWLILPDLGEMLLTRDVIKIIFHEPIETSALTLADVDSLKNKTYTIINEELKKHGH